MDVDITNNEWDSGTQRLHWREFYTPLFAGISLVFCITAQVLYCKFPRLLKFPRCLLSWLNCYNMYYLVYVFLKWLPVTPWHNAWAAKVVPRSPECLAVIWIDFTQSAGPVACNTLLCLTIFLATVCRIDVEKDKRIFWAYFTFAFIYPPVIAFPLTFSLADSTEFKTGSSCRVSLPWALYLARVPVLFFVFLQVVLVLASIHHIRKTFSGVRTDSNFPLRYIITRFMASIISQSYNMVPSVVSQSFLDTDSAIWQRFSNSSHTMGPTLDAIIMILGNQDFIDWFKAKYLGRANPPHKPLEMENRTSLTTMSASISGSASTGSKDIESGISDSAIEMEDIHLAATPAQMGTSSVNDGESDGEIA